MYIWWLYFVSGIESPLHMSYLGQSNRVAPSVHHLLKTYNSVIIFTPSKLLWLCVWCIANAGGISSWHEKLYANIWVHIHTHTIHLLSLCNGAVMILCYIYHPCNTQDVLTELTAVYPTKHRIRTNFPLGFIETLALLICKFMRIQYFVIFL